MELLEAANSILLSFQTLADALDNPPKPRDWHTKLPIKRMKYALKRQSLDFKENVDSLLGPFADNDDVLATLCEDLRNERWKDKELVAAVGREYARSYEPIQSTLRRMRALLDDVRIGVGEIESSVDRIIRLPESLVSFRIPC